MKTNPQPTAKLIASDGSQAVRLPAEYRFEEATEVYIRRDLGTGDVILSKRPPSDWQSFMRLREQFGPLPDDFLADRGQGSDARDPFDGRSE